MKKLAVMMVLSLAVAGTSYAQTGAPRGNDSGKKVEQVRKDKGDFRKNDDGEGREMSPEQRATQRTEMLSQKLDLNNAQKKKLQALNLSYANQMDRSHKQGAGKGERNDAQHQQMERSRANWETEFKKIVTKKQYAQYEAERKQMQANRRNSSGKDKESQTKSNRSPRS